MLVTFNPHRLFLIAILFSGFLGYVFTSGVIAYGPLILMAIMVVIYELIGKEGVEKKYFFASLAWFPYVTWAGLVYVLNPHEGRYLSSHLLAILILPLLVLSFARLLSGRNSASNYDFLYKSLFIFIIFQLIICAGQISSYIFGVGFPVNEMYADDSMVTGTFYNSNDLAAAVLSILFFVLGLEKFFFKSDKYIFWLFAFILLLIAGSRSAIFLAVILFVFSKANSPKNIIFYGVLFFIISAFSIFYVGNLENEVVARFAVRLESLVNVLQHGVSSDNSMTARLSSYQHFLGKFAELGLGSMEINNYFRYSSGANFGGVDLLFQNPHSLIVEIGYWLGWPGLVLFFSPLAMLLRYSRRKLSLLAVFLLVSMIPSSILGSMLFYMFLILSFFDFRIREGNDPHALSQFD